MQSLSSPCLVLPRNHHRDTEVQGLRVEGSHEESGCLDCSQRENSRDFLMNTSRTIQATPGLRRTVVILVALILVAVACRQQEVDRSTADVRLAQSVQAQLDASPDAKGAASRVAIQAKDGTVTLTGTVDTIGDKAKVEQIVAHTSGVIHDYRAR